MIWQGPIKSTLSEKKKTIISVIIIIIISVIIVIIKKEQMLGLDNDEADEVSGRPCPIAT